MPRHEALRQLAAASQEEGKVSNSQSSVLKMQPGFTNIGVICWGLVDDADSLALAGRDIFSRLPRNSYAH